MRQPSAATAAAVCLAGCLATSTLAFQTAAPNHNRVVGNLPLLHSDPRVASTRSAPSWQPKPVGQLVGQRGSTTSLTISAGDNVNELRHDGSATVLQASVIVGTVTAAIGYLYGQALSASFNLLWKKFPVFLMNTFGLTTLNPVWFITGMCTFGGFLIGTLKAFPMFGGIFTVADFVTAFSAVPARSSKLPASRTTLLQLLLLSLLTSSFGFSIGPEAPMVCAGGLMGATLARKLYGKDANDKTVETLAYAGAAGSLTAFMGIPIAGSIFALEMTRSSAGLSTGARDALSPAVVASVAGLVLLRGVLIPATAVGGHFDYGFVGDVSGRAMLAAAAISGVGGALIGTTFHKVVKVLKKPLWPAAFFTTPATAGAGKWKRQIAVKTFIGLLVGLLSSRFPQTLFWGEGSLQCAIDGQRTAFAATHHGLSNMLTSAAVIDPSLPYGTAAAAFKVGMAKLVAIMLASAGKFPGGIIFPLFFAAAPFAHAAALSLAPTMPSLLPIMVMSFMASTQASVTRTPLASALILSLSASAGNSMSVMFPACLVSSYIAVWTAQMISKNSYFIYSD